MNLPDLKNTKVAVIGLGYVGLPLAVQISRTKRCMKTSESINRKVLGFDINQQRINSLINGVDSTNEIDYDILSSIDINFSSNVSDLVSCDVFIITVPTPLDKNKCPDFSYLISASKIVGIALKEKSKINQAERPSVHPIIIYESTVYPGATEEICLPVLEEFSSFRYVEDETNNYFSYGYSPERINPGDKSRTIDDVIKVTSGSSEKVANWIDLFYGSIIKVGTHKTSSIKIAEAAKVIENIQRDLNISLINELAMIFDRFDIDTLDVLDAADTKWNFIKFKPGLVGGHCIGIDPYYLTNKAKQVGYHTQVVTSGRRINDEMATWIVNKLISQMAKKRIPIGGSKILLLGFTFKEDCPDIRNTKVVDLIINLQRFGIEVDVVDPYVDNEIICEERNLKIPVKTNLDFSRTYPVVMCVVAHKEFKQLSKHEWRSMLMPKGMFFDLKGIIPRDLSPIRV